MFCIFSNVTFFTLILVKDYRGIMKTGYVNNVQCKYRRVIKCPLDFQNAISPSINSIVIVKLEHFVKEQSVAVNQKNEFTFVIWIHGHRHTTFNLRSNVIFFIFVSRVYVWNNLRRKWRLCQSWKKQKPKATNSSGWSSSFENDQLDVTHKVSSPYT